MTAYASDSRLYAEAHPLLESIVGIVSLGGAPVLMGLSDRNGLRALAPLSGESRHSTLFWGRFGIGWIFKPSSSLVEDDTSELESDSDEEESDV